MISEEAYQDQAVRFHNEADVMRHHYDRLVAFNDGKPVEIKWVTAEDGDETARAWRIVFNPLKASEVKQGLILDWDDTTEPYTERKNRLYEEYKKIIPEAQLHDKMPRIFKAINGASRVLPNSGQHPEHYSPYMELLATTALVKSIRAGDVPDFIKNIDAIIEGSSEESDLATQYLKDAILPMFNGNVDTKIETKKEKVKTYFVENKNQATTIDFDKKPFNVDGDVWNLYKKFMTESNIPADELQHFDTGPNVRVITATFGELGFQPEKILAGLEAIKKAGGRVPDEILIFTRGRKGGILEKIVNEIPGVPVVYADDSGRQVESVSHIPRILPVYAKRPGAKRGSEKLPDDILQVKIAELKHSELIAQAVEFYKK